jgi:hypothetical protein
MQQMPHGCVFKKFNICYWFKKNKIQPLFYTNCIFIHIVKKYEFFTHKNCDSKLPSMLSLGRKCLWCPLKSYKSELQSTCI